MFKLFPVIVSLFCFSPLRASEASDVAESLTLSAQQKESVAKCFSCNNNACKRCFGCNLAWYCDIECQKKNRQQHKERCKRIAKIANNPDKFLTYEFLQIK